MINAGISSTEALHSIRIIAAAGNSCASLQIPGFCKSLYILAFDG
jgi:hypothetical protein